MKKLYTVLALLLIAAAAYSQNYNVTFKSKIKFGGQTLANVCGFVKGGKEYALVGASKGMILVDITVPDTPVVLKQFTDTINSLWREIKMYGNYAYITSEWVVSGSGKGGLGIVNLSNLPDTSNIPFYKYYGDGAIANSLNKVHALHIDTTKGFAYLFGATGLANGGAVILKLTPNPYTPQYVGAVTNAYIHDGFVDNDTLFACHIYGGYITAYNCANKTSPVTLGSVNTPNNFPHNCWLTTNKQTMLTTDEVSNSFLAAYSVSNLGSITLKDKIQPTPGSGSIVHNTHIRGSFAVTSWYTDGFTMVDVSRPQNLIQVGRYDTYGGSGNGFNGCWGVYPYYPSGSVIASNISESTPDTGVLYILKATYVSACYLEGNVKDSVTNQNLNGVTVNILSSDPLTTTSTDITGNYYTGQQTNGFFTVTFSKAGYQNRIENVYLDNGQVTTLNIKLWPLSLPLQLLDFKAVENKSANSVSWTTSGEHDLRAYVVERRTAYGDWVEIGSRDPRNSLATNHYELADNDPQNVSYYRLKMVGMDGSVEYSGLAVVVRARQDFRLLGIAPVPAYDHCRVHFSTPADGAVEIAIRNTAGETVMTRILYATRGVQQEALQLTDLPAGMYYVTISMNGATQTGRLVKL